MQDLEAEKMNAAKEAAKAVRSGMTIGIGSGSTVNHFIRALGERVKEEGLSVTCVVSSSQSRRLAEENGLRVIEDIPEKLDIDFDGADEADLKGNLIKGGGGALTREKIVAYNSRELWVMVDSTKIKRDYLGRFPLPVEILPFMVSRTLKNLEEAGCSCSLRGGGAYRTDNGNVIADCRFKRIDDPAALERRLKMVPGVVEVGIFTSLTSRIIEGTVDGVQVYSIPK